jgi:hypothetical protein
MILTTWPNLLRPREGRAIETTASTFVARVLSPKTYRYENQWPRYATASFRDGYRCLDAFESGHAIVLDFDRGATREKIAHAYGHLFGVAHTTKSHTPEAGRWRVPLFTDRPFTADEHPRVWRDVAGLAERVGFEPDYNAADAPRAWAAPSAGPHYEAFELRGAFVDVDAALERIPAPTPPDMARYEPSSDDLTRRIERARRYLARMDPALSGSGGHVATIRAASAMVVGFDLPPDAALDLLWHEFSPRCSPPWSLRDLQHKVKSAARDARMPFGWLADAKRSA